MFVDMVRRLSKGNNQELFILKGLESDPVKIRIGTLCSGTDAPIFALRLLQKAVDLLGSGPRIGFEHVFSCEIEPFKQGFLRRNMVADTRIFRNVVEMARSNGRMGRNNDGKEVTMA